MGIYDPWNAQTNVYTIKGITSVQWTAYTHTDLEALIAAEYELRLKDLHVLLERRRGLLWVFVLVRAATAWTPPGEDQTSPADAAHRFNIELVSSGEWPLSDLDDLQNMLLRDPRSIVRKPEYLAHVFSNEADTSRNRSFEAPATNVRPSPSAENVITAVCKSALFSLARRGRCIPLSISNGAQFVIPEWNGARYTMGLCGPVSRRSRPEVFAIGAAFLPDGTVVVSSYPFEVSNAQLPEASDGFSLWLAPFCFSYARWAGVSDERSEAPRRHNASWSTEDARAFSWRKSCVRLLAHHGINVASDSPWTKVTVRYSDGKLPLEDELDWPTSLVLSRDVLGSSVHVRRSKVNLNQDALAKAEVWFLDREQREKRQAEKTIAKPPSVAEGLSPEDGAKLRVRHQQIELQNAAGVYPTPPDGAPTKNDAANEKEGTNSPQQTRQQPTEVSLAPDNDVEETSLASETGDGKYEEVDQDELFGEMGSEVLSRNEITEDDFRFFDEPGEGHVLVRSGTTGVESGDLRIHSQVGSQAVEKQKEVIGKASLQSLDSDQDKTSLSAMDIDDYSDQRPNMDASGGQSKAALNEDFLGVVSKGNYHASISLAESSVEADLSKPLDTKYMSAGKFAPLTSFPHPTGTAPGLLPRVTDAIPSLGTSGQKSAFDGSTDESSESDDDSSDYSGEARAGGAQGNSSLIASAAPSPEDKDKASGLIANLERLAFEPQDQSHRNKPTLQRGSMGLSDDEFIKLAQIVGEQFVYYESLNEPLKGGIAPITDDPLKFEVARMFEHSKQCTIEECIAIENTYDQQARGSIQSAQRSNLKRQESGKAGSFGSAPSVFYLGTSHVRATRGESTIDLSATALTFWAELSLSPFAGPKHMIAFLLCPDTPAFRQGASIFLDSLSQTFASQRLGYHEIGRLASDLPPGIVPTPPDWDRDRKEASAFCEQIASSLSGLSGPDRTILIYMAEQDQGVLPACRSFLRILNHYTQHQDPRGIVLQIVPLDWIISETTIAIQTPQKYIRLSRIVYDRCPLRPSHEASPYAYHSFVRLADSVPKNLRFRLTTDPVSPLDQASVVHVGYSWGSRWLSVAITDELGTQHWLGSYHLMPSNIRAVTRDIWEIAREAMPSSRIIAVAKKGQFTPAELEVWTALENVVLAEVDDASAPRMVRANPSLQAVRKVRGNNTAPDENDPNARLIDLRDETWGAVSSSCLVGRRRLDVDRSFANGYLIREGRTVSVSVVRTEEVIDVKDLLAAFHGLRIVARARSVDSELPWHLAVANRAQKALDNL